MARWLTYLFLFLPLAACGAGGGAEEATPTPTPREAAPLVRQVRTVAAATGTLRSARSTTVEIVPAQESRVAAKTSGQVAGILKREGATAEPGEPVVVLDAAHLQLERDNARVALESARVTLQGAQNAAAEGQSQAAAGLRAAETNLRLAESQFAEGEALFGAGGLARTELDGLGARLEEARAAHGRAQDALSRSERAEGEDVELLRLQLQRAETGLAGAEGALADAAVRAPFAGEVTAMLVEEGEFVGAGSPVFVFASTDALLARFSVPPEDANRLLEGGVVTLSYAGEPHRAAIIRSGASPGSRLVEMTAELETSGAPIPRGAVARLDYELELATGVKLPSGAVGAGAGESGVLLVEDGRTVRRAVQILGEAGDEVVVGGLEEGAQVVYPVPADLRPDTAVSIIATGDAQ